MLSFIADSLEVLQACFEAWSSLSRPAGGPLLTNMRAFVPREVMAPEAEGPQCTQLRRYGSRFGPWSNVYSAESALWMPTAGKALLLATNAAQWVCGCPSTMAVARMGCCTSLLYGPSWASKNTVKEQLTLIPHL